jgi:CRISPR-associated protein Cmr6
MVFYPLNKEQNQLINNFSNGNFSLWYNKYVLLSDDKSFKASDLNGKTDKAVNLYKDQFERMKKGSEKLLKNKHIQQIDFCRKFSEKSSLECTSVHAKLKSPLVVGIGQTHPNEISMTFDRNIGVPYIPSSSIKGVARFAFILSQILNDDYTINERFENKEEIDLDELGDFVKLFGGENKVKTDKTESFKGGVIFLDAYPADLPFLKVDIMNPHYGEYYKDEKGIIPPADYLTPVPIKFLTVKEGAEYVFRIVGNKEFIGQAKEALKKAITEEGVGAKTALGYGLFDIIEYNEPQLLDLGYKKYLEENISPEEKERLRRENFIEKVKNYSGNIDEIFNQWQQDEKLKDDKEIAKALKSKVKKKKSNGEFTYRYKIIADILEINLESDSSGKTQQSPSNDSIEKALAELDKHIKKKKISKKEYNKLATKYKEKEFKDIKEIVDKLSQIKKLMKK